jgi:predicted dehydrogenase
MISEAYLTHAARFRALEIVALADLDETIARARARRFGGEAMSVEALLAHPEVEAVVNLTIPAAHLPVGKAVLAAGKHLYTEKPLTLEVAEAVELLELARSRGLQVGCAPDTVLGAGLQTARGIIASGRIGRILSGTAMMMSAGPESFHGNPGFFYQYGAGPMLDMGPYYLTALVHLLGPVATVTGTVMRGFEERVCKHESIRGKCLPVEVMTHFAGVLEFVSGAHVTLVTSFDVQAHRHAPIELYGELGSLHVPDPNTFGGPVELFTPEAGAWEEQPLTHAYAENTRILGLVEMIEAIEAGRVPRCSGELALHVLEVMRLFEESAVAGRRLAVASRPAQPDALPPGYRFAEGS